MVAKSKVLILGYVWPEPRSSAAGLRDRSLVEMFVELGWDVVFGSGSKDNEWRTAIEGSGARTAAVAANDPGFDAWVRDLDPDCVIFDRFVTEEQFGWRVREACPRALRVLDTQDLHFLRRSRERAILAGASVADAAALRFPGGESLETEAGPDLWRELASIHRSDLVLVLSDFERSLLAERYGVPAERLVLLPLSYRPAPPGSPAFSEREGFVMIGNFRHPPNWDGVRWFHREIWPRIRRLLVNAEVNVYGAYPPREAMALDSPVTGFRVRGPVEDQYAALARGRVNLAPLRYGAGVKGKIADGWLSGTPCVTTSIGAEGMGSAEANWGGEIVSAETDGELVDRFACAAVKLYVDAGIWGKACVRGHEILRAHFDHCLHLELLARHIVESIAELDSFRSRNLTGAMLWHHTLQSTKYLSRWIELKEATRAQVAESSSGL